MKFMVKRQSDYRSKPCEEAKKEQYVRIESIPWTTPYEDGWFDTDFWFNEGYNHRKEGDRLVREMVEEAWFVEFGSLEEFVQFKNKYGELILTTSPENEEINLIEIQDVKE